MNTFEAYLAKKLIDPQRMRSDLPDFWKRLQAEFEAGGEQAFDARNKFHINNLRLQYPQSAPTRDEK